MSDIGKAAALACAVGSASFALSQAKISAPLRMRVAEKTRGGHRGWIWLSDLLACPYCTGTWLSAAAVAVYRLRVVDGGGPADYVVSVLAVSGAAMLPVHIIQKAAGK
jgi:Protein of unknown function (DUF1360)